MDFATLEPALAAWFATLLGLDPSVVRWENAPAIVAMGPSGCLSWVSTGSTNVDDVQWQFDATATDPLLEMVPGVRTDRLCALQLSVETRDQSPGRTARALLEQARDRLYWPSSIATLLALNVGIVDDAKVLTADYRDSSGRRVSRAVCLVRLNVTSFAFDTAGRVPSIAEVVVTPTITDVSDTPLPAALEPGGPLP